MCDSFQVEQFQGWGQLLGDVWQIFLKSVLINFKEQA